MSTVALVADAAVDPEIALQRRVDEILAEWEPPTGTTGSKAEKHAREVVSAARAALLKAFRRQDAESAEAVEEAVRVVREELGGLNDILTEANGELLSRVDHLETLLARLGMATEVATQVAVTLVQRAVDAIVTPGGGTVGAGSEGLKIGDLIIEYSAGEEPTVEIGNPVTENWVRYRVGEDGLTEDQLTAISVLFGNRAPVTADPLPGTEG